MKRGRSTPPCFAQPMDIFWKFVRTSEGFSPVVAWSFSTRNFSLSSAKDRSAASGVTRPVTLVINAFTCKPHPVQKKEACGADAVARFNRADFGIDFGAAYGFKMDVLLRIHVEGLRAD